MWVVAIADSGCEVAAAICRNLSQSVATHDTQRHQKLHKCRQPPASVPPAKTPSSGGCFVRLCRGLRRLRWPGRIRPKFRLNARQCGTTRCNTEAAANQLNNEWVQSRAIETVLVSQSHATNHMFTFCFKLPGSLSSFPSGCASCASCAAWRRHWSAALPCCIYCWHISAENDAS